MYSKTPRDQLLENRVFFSEREKEGEKKEFGLF